MKHGIWTMVLLSVAVIHGCKQSEQDTSSQPPPEDSQVGQDSAKAGENQTPPPVEPQGEENAEDSPLLTSPGPDGFDFAANFSAYMVEFQSAVGIALDRVAPGRYKINWTNPTAEFRAGPGPGVPYSAEGVTMVLSPTFAPWQELTCTVNLNWLYMKADRLWRVSDETEVQKDCMVIDELHPSRVLEEADRMMRK